MVSGICNLLLCVVVEAWGDIGQHGLHPLVEEQERRRPYKKSAEERAHLWGYITVRGVSICYDQ